MSGLLDSRVIRIVLWLLDQGRPRSTAELALDLGLSERVVRYRLSVVDNYLTDNGAELLRQRGTGLSIKADDETRAALIADLEGRAKPPRVYSPDERNHLMLDALLWAAPDITSLDRLADRLEVSKTSARRDLTRIEPWLDRQGLPLLRRPGKGLVVVSTERQVRRAIVQLILESVPADALRELSELGNDRAQMVRTRIPSGLRERLEMLPIEPCTRIVRGTALEEVLSRGASELTFVLYLAVSIARFADHRSISLEPGQFVSLTDHPAYDGVADLAKELAAAGLIEFGADEIAGITEYLLGIDALVDAAVETTDNDGLLNELLTVAGERLHPSLADVPELRRGLSMHLARLSVRLRHGLPVHNPLLHEVRSRYPDVHTVSEELGERIGAGFERTIGQDEIGFITMYLSGALERGHLRPRRRALIVCPSGMATAWVLVSRIQAEFPELALVDVMSERDFARQGAGDVDLVISTVELPPHHDVRMVVVGPLLSAGDVQAVSDAI